MTRWETFLTFLKEMVKHSEVINYSTVSEKTGIPVNELKYTMQFRKAIQMLENKKYRRQMAIINTATLFIIAPDDEIILALKDKYRKQIVGKKVQENNIEQQLKLF